MSRMALEKLQEKFGEAVLDTHNFRGDETAVVDPSVIIEVLTWLRDQRELKFDMLTDLTAVDYLPAEPRFAVVYHLYSVALKHRLRIKVPISEETPELDSAHELWGCANWAEREIWDMYGIRFNGHPDPRRILMYEEFVGHPLRKDYPKEKRQPLLRRPEPELKEVARPGAPRPLTPLLYKDYDGQG